MNSSKSDASPLVRNYAALSGGALDKANAEMKLMNDGILELHSSSAEMGQCLVSDMAKAMVMAEELGIEPGRVRVLVIDTDLMPDGGPTTA